jgi:hypothetical protein
MTEESTRKQRKDIGKRRALTNLQRFQAMELLKTNGASDGQWFKFSEGWSDERIASIIDCGVQQVATIRRDCLGDLKPVVSNTGGIMPIIWDHIKGLDARVQQLEAAAKRHESEDQTRLVMTHTLPFRPNGA